MAQSWNREFSLLNKNSIKNLEIPKAIISSNNCKEEDKTQVSQVGMDYWGKLFYFSINSAEVLNTQIKLKKLNKSNMSMWRKKFNSLIERNNQNISLWNKRIKLNTRHVSYKTKYLEKYDANSARKSKIKQNLI